MGGYDACPLCKHRKRRCASVCRVCYDKGHQHDRTLPEIAAGLMTKHHTRVVALHDLNLVYRILKREAGVFFDSYSYNPGDDGKRILSEAMPADARWDYNQVLRALAKLERYIGMTGREAALKGKR
jgi:hypothetical protein